MTFQGARARAADDESRRVFEVSRIRLDQRGRISEVLWREVNAKSDGDVGAEAVVSSADVVDAIHDGAQVLALFSTPALHLPDRCFVVVEHDDGQESITLDDLPAHGRMLADMPRLGR